MSRYTKEKLFLFPVEGCGGKIEKFGLVKTSSTTKKERGKKKTNKV